MTHWLKFPVAFFLCVFACCIAGPGAETITPPAGGLDNYIPGPDSKQQPGVPRGKIFSFKCEDSKIFPGTTRGITVYIPAQYKADKPACVYVGLDGLGFDATVVFDNLINKSEMPVTIAIGISPGAVTSADGKTDPRFNRSFEFDGLNDSLARFIVEELYPEVETHQTPDGLPIKLSRDPNDACTGGGSTGGIAAFTLAWERPDLFRRVFTAIGTFVGMRGGDRYPVIVRKTEPKPIRVFQQDSENDEWMGGPEVGDWWMSNQTLERALEFSGYEHQHVWGTGPHSGKQGTALFPDAMRYLWKDWPKPIVAQTAKSQNVILKATLDPDSQWEMVGGAGSACHSLVVNPKGEVCFTDATVKHIRKLGTDGKIADFPSIPPQPFAFDAKGHEVTIGDGVNATCVTIAADGRTYVTSADDGKVWLISGKKILLDEGLKRPTAIALSPDGLWLAVFENQTHVGYSYRVKSDGTVDAKQKFYWVHVPDDADDSGAGSMCMDREGHAYVATRMGIQIFDRNGRSRGILPMPAGVAADSVAFGGEKFDTLFATAGGKLFQRKMKAAGAPAFLPPIKLPPWGAG